MQRINLDESKLMKNDLNSSTAPAPAGRISHAAKMEALVAAGELAVELYRAESIAAVAKAKYHERIRLFESWHGRSETRINPDLLEHAPVIVFTASEYKSYQDAKRKAANVRRRLKTASRNAVAAIGAAS